MGHTLEKTMQIILPTSKDYEPAICEVFAN